MMRKVSAYLLMSLDGVVEAPESFVREDSYDDVVDVLRETIAEQDAIVLGRKMFVEWSEYWPTADHEPFATFINEHPKYVASSTLRSVDTWANSSLIDGDLADQLTVLKSQPGNTIGVHGSITLVNSLLSAGLLDELRLTVFPALAGRGRRLFENGEHVQQLTSRSSRTTPKGLQYLVYERPR
jgi:dihydrofolate reductase